MRKIAGLFGMALIVAILAGADLYVLTRADSLSMLAAGELRKIAGDALEWDSISATIDKAVALQGTVTLEGVRGFPLARRLPPVQAKRARIHLRSGFPERFVLEEVRGVLSDELFDELMGKETGKSIRDVFPDSSKLPTIVVQGGKFETRLSAIFEGARPHTLQIGALSLVPIGGYRYHLEGEFTSELYGRWTERGEVDLDTGAQRLALDCVGLRITPELRAPLIEKFQQIYDKFLPGGLCDIHVRIEKEAKKEPDIPSTSAGSRGRRGWPRNRWYPKRAAPSAPPASPAAGWTQILSNIFSCRIFPLPTQLRATPPARQRFFLPVSARA